MADYPREIKLDARTEQRLIAYINDELTRHYAERGDFIKNLKSWQVDYWAEPSTTSGTFPFKDSATLIVPLAAITVEAIHSRVMTTQFALDQFVAAKSTGPKWTNHARPVERFLDHELLKVAQIRRPINDSTLEIIKYGTGVGKAGYCKRTRTAVRERDGKEEEFTLVVKQNATVDSVPVASFLMPLQYQNAQESSWCGEEHTFTPYEIRLMENSGMFAEGTMEKLSAHFSSSTQETSNSGSAFTNQQAELESRTPTWPDKLTTVELWMAFDVDDTEGLVHNGIIPREEVGNSFEKEIVVHYHQASNTILSVRYNWHEDLRRPYETGIYFPVEHRWAGIGVCKQVEQFQAEITTQHRQRIDNATLANCRMIRVSSLSNYGPNEPIFPGKIWTVDNKDDIDTFQLGEIYPSSYSNENQALLYVQQRTGVNEVNLGMPQSGTPGTATSDLARIQEGNKKFDYTYGNLKDFSNRLVQQSILNIKQFGPRASVYYELVENGDLVKEFFSQDFDSIKNGMLLDITIAGQQDNKLLDRNNWMQITQLLTSYYQNMLSLAQQKGDPALTQRIVDNGLTAATETMKQVLESFDLKNVDRILVEETLYGKLGSFAQAGPTGAIAGAGAPAGMGGVPQLPAPNGGQLPPAGPPI